MKKNKLLLVLAAFVVALFVLAACDNDEPVAETPTEAGETPTQAVVDDPTDPADDGDEIVLTIHYHAGANGVFDEDWPVWREIAERTGVRLTGTANPIADNAQEQFNLEAVDQFPADIYAGPGLGDLFRQYGQEGAFQPLNDLIAQYAPNIRAFLDERPDIENFLMAPDGNIYFIPNIQDGFVTYTMFMRTDWLDELGLDQPDTFEEFEAALFAFRDEMPALTGNDVVFPFFADSWMHMMRMIPMFGARGLSGDTGQRIILSEDDVMYHGWITDEFMTAIQGLSRWYDEGLIDPQIFTRGGTSRQEMLSQNMGGVTIHWPVSTAAFNAQLRDDIEGFRFEAIQPVIGLDGERVTEAMRTAPTNTGWGISHNNQHPEATMRMMDFLFSEEGRVLLSFGIEGETWEMVNGERVFMDYVHEHDMPATNFLRTRGGLRWLGWRAFFEHEMALASPEALQAFEIMNNADLYTRQTPSLAFNAAERAAIDDIQSNLNAFLDENIQAMILNPWEDVEGRWESFVQEAIAMGAHELVEAFQSAFDRFQENFGN